MARREEGFQADFVCVTEFIDGTTLFREAYGGRARFESRIFAESIIRLR
jgi:hypothetical protein